MMTSVALLLIVGLAWGEHPPAPFVDAQSLEPSLKVDLMYFGPDNFVGRPIDGYGANICYLTLPAAEALKKAQARLQERAREQKRPLTLLLKDCYRPQRAIRDMMQWIQNDDKKMQAKFYPSLSKPEIVSKKYLSPTSGHNRGNTIDLTVAEITAVGTVKELAMGGMVDFFGEISWSDAKNISVIERQNRELLKNVMGEEFERYSKEWWHFSLKREPNLKETYDFPIEAKAKKAK